MTFRDWLKAHPDEVARYAAIKQSLARAHASDPDFDDYTRAKTAYSTRCSPCSKPGPRRDPSSPEERGEQH